MIAPLSVAPVLARGLGVEGRGESGALISTMILLPVLLSVGTPMVLRVAAAKDSQDSNEMVRALRILAFFAGILTAGATALAFGYLASALGAGVALVFSITLPVCVSAGILWIGNTSVLIGRGEVVHQALTLAVPSVFFALTVSCLWVANELSVESTLWAQALSYVMTFALSSVSVRVSARGSRTRFSTLLRSGGRFAGGQVAEAASYRLDQIVVLPVLGASAAGLYATSVTIALLPFFVAQVVAGAAFRQSAQEHLASEAGDSIRLVRVLVLVGLLSGGLLAVLTPWLVPFLFGDEFIGAVVPTMIGLVGAVFLAAGQGCMTLLSIRGRGWLISLAQTAGLVFALMMLFVIGPPLGATGAALASTIGYGLATSIFLVGLRPRWADLAPRASDVRGLLSIFLGGRY